MEVTRAKYKTKPFDSWKKAKELTQEYYQNVASAHEKGKLLVMGCAGTPYPMLAGLGDYVYLQGEPYGATVAFYRELSTEAMKAFEEAGYAPDLCAYGRNFVGSVFIDKYVSGGPFPKMDFIWSSRHCPAGHPQWHKIVADYQGIPICAVDDELMWPASGSEEQRIEYFIGQYLDSIEWMEKVTGRRFDLEKAAEAMDISYEQEILWAEVNLLNAHVPSPADLRSMMTFMPVALLRRGEQCGVDFTKELRDEMRDRIANGIASVPDERYRLLILIPPWSSLALFRRLEERGVVFPLVVVYFAWAHVEFHDDGNIVPAKTPKQRGQPEPKTREDLIRTFVNWKMEHKQPPIYNPIVPQALYLAKMAKFFKASGVVLLIDNACPPSNIGLLDFKVALEQAGIPSITTQTNRADWRSADEQRFLPQIESFLATLEPRS